MARRNITMTSQKTLTNREQEVVTLLLEGKSNKQIAASLHITERTVEFHLNNIYTKHEVSSRVELVVKLGISTVADRGQFFDNGDKPQPSNGVTLLRDAVSQIIKELNLTTMTSSNVRGDGSRMTFFEAIRVCLITKYADFTGTASRAEFWWFALFVTLVSVALATVSEILGDIFMIAMLLPFLAVGTRRLRDSAQSVWWQLFLLVPVAGIIVLGFKWALPPVSPLPNDTIPA
jgi:DNA-binding CsgD family transcriptional regulator